MLALVFGVFGLIGAGAAQTVPPKATGPMQNTTPPAPKAPPKAPSPQKKSDPAAAEKQQVAGTLRTSYSLLAAANSAAYGNHINIALGEVQAALAAVGAPEVAAAKKAAGVLKGHTATFAKTIPIHGINLDQAASDAMVYQAGQLLNGLETVLESQKKFPAAQPHIRRAVKEITAALTISAVVAIKGKEADILTGAYVLLAVANDNYAGHQNKAKGHVKNAIDTLEAGVLSRGSIAQKVQAMRDALAQGKADGASQLAGPLRLPQPTSDVCVQLAGALIARVGPLTKGSVTDELSKAVMEIGAALAIR